MNACRLQCWHRARRSPHGRRMRDAPPPFVSVLHGRGAQRAPSRGAWPDASIGAPSHLAQAAQARSMASAHVGVAVPTIGRLPLPRAARAQVKRRQSFSDLGHPGRARARLWGRPQARSPTLRWGEHLRVGASRAEREGFEPSVRLPVHMISSHAPSASRSPLLRPDGLAGGRGRGYVTSSGRSAT
jgi:hypothetical protein